MIFLENFTFFKYVFRNLVFRNDFFIFFQNCFQIFFSECFLGCFDTSGSMIPLLVPKIPPWEFFVTDEEDGAGMLDDGSFLH